MRIPKWARYIVAGVLFIYGAGAVIGDWFLLQTLLSGVSRGWAFLVILLGGAALLGVALIPLKVLSGGYSIGIQRAESAPTKFDAWLNFIVFSGGGIILAYGIEYLTGLIVGLIASR